VAPVVDTSRFRIEPDTVVDLAERDADVDDGWSKSELKDLVEPLNARLEELQELLYANGGHRLLVVLQATDTGGNDGTNPQGVKVASFKKPSETELARDYLWRVHQQVPADGEITIFNRSHYEDVLVVRVHGLVPEERWSRRYHHIREFERLLADEGTTIIKIYLHITKDEQKARLQSRLDEPHKHWKFAKGDLAERARWDDYQEAFEAMMSETSTPWAPWYVVPACDKHYRNLVVSQILVETLEAFDMEWPEPEDGLADIVIE
jgi:PPK2 family polyphosphate:nucleotide phosphotransferase